MTTATIHLNQLSFSWMDSYVNKPCLSIPEWHVNKGEKVFLQGPSGSGKSTLLNLLSGMLLPTTGEVTLLNHAIHQMNSKARDRFRAQYLGVIFQQFNLIPYLSAYDNIRLSGLFANTENTTDRIEYLCKKLHLEASLLHLKANQLSIGQQQRVAAARALLHSPPIIIADEPTSSLDTDNRNEFIQLLLEESERCQSTVLFVSHDSSLAHHFDRVDNIIELQSPLSHSEVSHVS